MVVNSKTQSSRHIQQVSAFNLISSPYRGLKKEKTLGGKSTPWLIGHLYGVRIISGDQLLWSSKSDSLLLNWK